MDKELIVIYRACNSETDGVLRDIRPKFFDKKKCFKSMYDSFSSVADIYVVWDGSKDSELFKYIDNFHWSYGAAVTGGQGIREIMLLGKFGNQGSLLYCYDWYNRLKERYKYVFFCEDDNLFLPVAGEVTLCALKTLQQHNSLFTPYDNIHRYSDGLQDDITRGMEWIVATKYSHVRTCESTTCTVSMSREVFDKLKDDLEYYCRKGTNAPEDRSFYRAILEKGFRLWSALPSYMTHCCNVDLAPYIEWDRVSNDIVL